MAKRALKSNLSVKGINNLIEQLNAYKNDLNAKQELFISRLINEIGIPVVDAKYGAGMGDSSSDHSNTIVIVMSGDEISARLTVSGKDLLFIEFGAGITYNNGTGHPLAKALGYGVGTYPGQHNAFKGYWWYKDANDNLRLSYGTEATMPVYNAWLAMYGEVARIAKEVFNK